MKIIYIAGPYRASCEWEVVQNIRQAEKAALFVWSHGAAAICPHKNTALFGGANAIHDETWLNGDIEIMLRCDAVWAIDGWRYSEGAKNEIMIASENGIPVLFTHNDVKKFLIEAKTE